METTASRKGLTIGDAAPKAILQDCHGERVALAERWSARPLLIQFARHLGCPFCRDRAKQLKLGYSEIQQHGGDVVFITMGPLERAQQFKDGLQLPFEVLVDLHCSAYHAYRVPRGDLLQIAGPKVWLSGLGAVVRSGVGQPTGDILQLQGTFVVDTSGVLRLAHVPRHSADHPAMSEILLALDPQPSEA